MAAARRMKTVYETSPRIELATFGAMVECSTIELTLLYHRTGTAIRLICHQYNTCGHSSE